MILSGSFWTVLAGTALVHWLLPARARLGFLAAVSCAWLLSLDAFSVATLTAFALATWLLAPRLTRPGHAVPLAALVLASLGWLAWFKYLPPALAALRGEAGPQALVLPLGISYFTFKLIHFAVETARGNQPRPGLDAFLCYAFLFPTFTAGPIERIEHFLAQRSPRFDPQLLAEGLTRIAHGLVKRFVLVGMLIESLSPDHGSASKVARLMEDLPGLPVAEAWTFCGLSFLVMYLDFSAYSDIAIGGSRLFGIRIMENFRWPILAGDISGFWSRWHMTLTGWCQAYVFMPVLGLTRRLGPAVVAGFLAIGVWHAGTTGWALWGLYHACGVIAFHAWQAWCERRAPAGAARAIGPLRRAAGTALTLAFVTGSFALLAGDDAGGARDGLRLLAKLVGVDLWAPENAS